MFLPWRAFGGPKGPSPKGMDPPDGAHTAGLGQ